MFWKIASMRFEMKKQDMWIGVYWRQDRYALHVWVCLLPMLPLHIIVL